MAQTLAIVGAGGFGRAVREALEGQDQLRIAGFLDDRFPTLAEVDGLPLLGPSDGFAALVGRVDGVVLAIGNNASRERLAGLALDAGLQLHTVVHSRAIVTSNAQLAEGAIVMAGAVVGAGVRIGRGSIVNYGAVLDHDGVLGAFARIGAGACLGGAVRVGRRVWVHDGACVATGSQLADDMEVTLDRRLAPS